MDVENIELTKSTLPVVLPDGVSVAYITTAKAKDTTTNITEVGVGVSLVQAIAEKNAKYEALAHLAGFTEEWVNAH